jgi:TonB family protein
MNLLLDSALKATIILIAAWAASLALRRASADLRHTIWLVATLAVALLPAVLSIPQSALPSAAHIIVSAAIPTAAAATRQLPWLLLIWAAGAILILTRLIAGVGTASRITRSARSVDGVLYSDRAQTPLTWGFFRPVVILPAYAENWTAAERDLVIRHERAHITRHDWLWQILSSLLTAVFWFHPLMWLARIELLREAEGAADDMVLSHGATPADYADRLVHVARQLRGASLAAVIPMIRKPELETRVRSILDPARRRAAAGLIARCTIALAAVLLIFPIAMIHAQGKVYKVGGDVTAPRILSKVEPEYTPEAKDAKIEGAVKLQAEVTPAGIAENIRVITSLDAGLDANAVTAVSNWRFQPGIRNGEPVTVAVTIEVNFHLL